MRLTEDEVTGLSCAIVQQAVDDYRLLKRKNRTSGGRSNEGEYNIRELEEFFRGSFCEFLLEDGLKYVKLTGEDIIRAVS